MNRVVTWILFILFIFLLDRFFFLPGRMDGTWEYESGVNAGDYITFDNIDIVSNYEIQISANRGFDSFYLIGCYFGTLYLLDKNTLEYTVYTRQQTVNYSGK